MREIQAEFDRRFYSWSLNDWKREIQEDFSFLRLLTGAGVEDTLDIILNLPEEQIDPLVTVLVKRFWRHKQASLDFQFTEDDQNVVDWYMESLRKYDWEMSAKIPAGGIQIDPSKKLKRKYLKKCIVSALEPIVGKACEEEVKSGVWQYETKIGPWTVLTGIDTGGRFHQLCYDHCIVLSDTQRLMEHISILSWLGISGQTSWSGLQKDDAEVTADTVAQIVRHFLQTVPNLLQGLTPDL